MIQFPSFPHRKIFLTVLALVLVSLTVLVAQNAPQTIPPSKEAAPAETGPEKKEFVTDQGFPSFTGEEYLVYEKKGKIALLDPATKNEETSFQFKSAEEFYKQNVHEGFLNRSNLGKYEETRNKLAQIPDESEGSIVNLITMVAKSPNGNIITNTNGEDGLFTATISSPGIPDFVLDHWLDRHDDSKRTTSRNAIGWLDKTHLLVSKGNLPYDYDGIFIVDISTGKEVMLLPPLSYVETPSISPSGHFLFYKQVKGEKFNGGEDYLRGDGTSDLNGFIYDFKTKKTFKVDTDSGWLFGWTTTKEISQGPGHPGFFSPTTGCEPFNCLYSNNSVIYKLPFKCGSVYRVSRDGSCNSPIDCGFGNAAGPLFGGSGTAHNKRALDFTRSGVSGYDAEMPVFAAAGGQVIKAGLQNNYTCLQYPTYDAGYGYHVAIKHSDGTCTIYGHMKEGSAPVLGAQVVQGQQIGIEWYSGHTDPCGVGGKHIHFERRLWVPGGQYGSYGTGLQSYWMEFFETGSGKLPQNGRLYTSQNGNCSMDCSNVTTLPACGGTFTNQSNVGLPNKRSTYFVSMPTLPSGNAASQNESGGEKMYKITTTTAGPITVTLSNFSGPAGSDLDVFILASNSCENLDPLLHPRGISQGWTATYTGIPPGSGAPAGTYYIIVDGVNGSAGSFTLNVTAPCGGGGFNCNNAVALSNGVAYNGNNSGGGSNVTTYNCEPSWSETGPEKVYSFNHTGGNISVNLIETGGADLDAFLLSSCSPTNCLLALNNGLSTISQPAGTYYIVVDGYMGAVGSYTLTISSSGGGGGFNCNNAVVLSNGVAYNGNNTGGGNNVTTYNCQSGWSETGPEKVHSYYHTGGTITVNLAQSVDVDVFLLGSCSANNCLLGFDNGVASSSQPAGTYYIVVDGYQGAAGSYTLTVSSSSGGGGSNDNICGAAALSVNSTCISTNGTNVGATPSTPAPNVSCPIDGYKDVWFKFTMPNVATPQVTIRTTAGSLNDAVMEVYYGSCSSPTYIVCEDDNSSSQTMPVINLQGGAGATIWVRVWGWNGGTGTFSICVLNYYSQNFGNDGGDIVVIDPNVGDRGQSTELIPTRQLVHTCEVSVSGSDISVSNVDPKSEYILLNTVGQVICQGKAIDGTIRCSANVTGVYFMSIVDGMGNKCVQKIFVN